MPKCDGHIRQIESSDLIPGAILGMVHPQDIEALPPFSDFMVCEVGRKPEDREIMVEMIRPYACFHVMGEENMPTLKWESLRIEASRVVHKNFLFRLVIQASGKPFNFKY